MNSMQNTGAWRDKIRRIMTFRYLSDQELDSLLACGTVIEYEAEEPIVKEGDIDQNFFGILSGTVSVNVLETEGKDVYICSLGAGEIFGEAGFFLNIKRTASVIAKEKTAVFRVTRKELTSYIHRFPAAGNRILYITIYGLLRKLRQANQELAYERKADMEQGDIDELVNGLMGEMAPS